MQAAILLTPRRQSTPLPQPAPAHEARKPCAVLTEDQYLNASLALMARLKSRMALGGAPDTHPCRLAD